MGWKSIVFVPVTVALLLGIVSASGMLFGGSGFFKARFGPGGPCAAAPGAGSDAPPPEAIDPRFMPGLLHAFGDPARTGLRQWPRQFDAAPFAIDLNEDGVDEIVAQGNDTNVYVFDAATGRALAVLPTCRPHGWYVERVLNEADGGRLRPGEPMSLVVASHAGYLTAWTFEPEKSTPARFSFHKAWEVRADACHPNPSMDAKATLADLDGDGTLEILAQIEEEGMFAYNADGTVRWKHCWAGGNASPLAEDLDGDGRPEAIFASDNGLITVVNGASGRVSWTFHAAEARYGVTPGSISVAPTVTELDGVAPKEVLFTARHAPSGDPALFDTFHMAIFAVRGNVHLGKGEVVWMRQPEWANPLSYTHLVVDDVDGDGSPDIFGQDWNTVGHLPGRWEHLGPSHVFRLDAQGNDVWVREVESWWSNKDIALVRTDQGPALWVNGVKEHSDGLWSLSAADGSVQGFVHLYPWQVQRGPRWFDVRHDGNLQIALPVTLPGSNPLGAILLFDESAFREKFWRA